MELKYRQAHHSVGVLFLLFNSKLREKHMNRIEVLDRVGELLLLPNTELATAEPIADSSS